MDYPYEKVGTNKVFIPADDTAVSSLAPRVGCTFDRGKAIWLLTLVAPDLVPTTYVHDETTTLTEQAGEL